MAKRRSEAPREGKYKPFDGSPAYVAHDQMLQQSVTSPVPSPLSNQILDLLQGCLDNIAATAIQAVANGGQLAEFFSSLEFLVHTVHVQSKEIKIVHQQTNVLKNKGNQKSSSRKTEGGGMPGIVCPHCAVFERLDLHKKNSCLFDPENMTDRREWACKSMGEKGVACKDKN